MQRARTGAHTSHAHGGSCLTPSPLAVRASLQPSVRVSAWDRHSGALCPNRQLMVNPYVTAQGVGTQPTSVCRGILASQGLNRCGRGLPASTHLFPDPLPQRACFWQDHRPGRAKPGVRVSGPFTRHGGLTGPEGPHALLGEEPAPAPQSGRPGGSRSSSCLYPRPQHPGWCSQPRANNGLQMPCSCSQPRDEPWLPTALGAECPPQPPQEGPGFSPSPGDVWQHAVLGHSPQTPLWLTGVQPWRVSLV